jgi:hypothetical protein
LWKFEINVGEYNTLDLVKDNTIKKNIHFLIYLFVIFEMQEKGHIIRQEFRHKLDFGHQMAAVCVQSFRLIQ